MLRREHALVFLSPLVLVSLGIGMLRILRHGHPVLRTEAVPGDSLYREVMETVVRSYVVEPDVDRAAYGAVRGLVASLDRHSRIYDASEWESARRTQEGRFSGIGIQVQLVRGEVLILDVVAGSPAAESGIQPLDVLLAVDGTPIPAGPDLAELGGRLRGPAGSEVLVRTARGSVESDHRLQRRILETPAAYGRLVDLESGVGVIWVQAFSSHTVRDVDAALSVLREAGLRALVLDLRGNLGGLLDAATGLAGRFLEDVPIVTTRGRQEEKVVRAGPTASDARLPLVVLIDRRTASASEVLAGALQDHGRAPLAGERSYGKGVVQTVAPFTSGWTGGLKLTTAHHFTPAGRCIEKDIGLSRRSDEERGGLLPDLAIPMSPEEAALADRARERLRYRPAVAALLAREDGQDPLWRDPVLAAAVDLLREGPSDRPLRGR
jgi:carboxyl-terminal processing protease